MEVEILICDDINDVSPQNNMIGLASGDQLRCTKKVGETFENRAAG